MKLQDAQAIAREVIAALAPACERIEVAGGVRRHKPDPHDIEIVALPRFREEPLGFFDTQRVAETDGAISAASASGLLRLDSDVKRNGPRYKRFLSRGTETIVELFLVHDPAQWGVTMMNMLLDGRKHLKKDDGSTGLSFLWYRQKQPDQQRSHAFPEHKESSQPVFP